MSRWSRVHTWVAGMAVILLTNALALGNVAWNRSGPPESVLRLSQRELRQPYWGANPENSGLSLELVWRSPMGSVPGRPGADWLDAAKLRSLGIEADSADGQEKFRRPLRQLSKPVLLVLELDGPAYRQALEAAQRHLDEAQAKLAADPDKEALKRQADGARQMLALETTANSRLFAIDAGLELAALRAQYPDRSRYAIVPGLVHPYGGISSQISINVPFALRGKFGQPAGQRLGQQPSQPMPQAKSFAATVAFGSRLEPWLQAIETAQR